MGRRAARPRFAPCGSTDLIELMIELDPNQGGHEARKPPAAADQSGQFAWVRGKTERLCALQSPLIREWIQFSPGKLRLPKEYIDGNLADPLDLVQKLSFALGIPSSDFAKFPQVALIHFDEHLRGFAEHSGSALIVTRVTAFIECTNTLLPGTGSHLFRRRPAPLEQNPRGSQCDIVADARTEQYCADQ